MKDTLKIAFFCLTMKDSGVQNQTNKKIFRWTVPLNCLWEFVQRFNTIYSTLFRHYRQMVFVFNTIIQTDISSPDCHYCLGGGVVTERPEASKRVCVCAIWMKKWGMGGGGDYWPPESETKSHCHRKQHSILSASSLARCLGLTEHMSRAKLKSRAETYKELHLTHANEAGKERRHLF